MDHVQSDRVLAAVLHSPPRIQSLPPIGTIRYEVKFAGSQADLPRVQAWIDTNRCGLFRAFPDRVVHSVYLDTFDLSAYQDNVAGISQRAKMRFRWYGEGLAPPRGTLEIKCRKDSIGWKWSWPIEQTLDLQALTWQSFLDTIKRPLPDAFRFMLEANATVSLVNRYVRSYFESRDRRLRVTLDRDLAFFPQMGRARPALLHGARHPDAVVLELKCAVADRGLGARALANVPLRASRHSKYAVGVESLLNL